MAYYARRRIHSRVAARFKVDYDHQGNYLISYSKNISVDGMFICTKAPPPVGACLRLVFSIDGLHEVMVSARVVWAADGESDCPGIGVKFLDPPEHLKEAVLKMVNRIVIV